jgi:hypothetical protein
MEPMKPYFQAGDGILADRIIALVELGMLERRGDPMNIWQSEVRLRNQVPTGIADTALRQGATKRSQPDQISNIIGVRFGSFSTVARN